MISNSTFSGNSATSSGGGVNVGIDSGSAVNAATNGDSATHDDLWVWNSILVNNKTAAGADCSGPLPPYDGGYNLTNANGGGFSTASHDILTDTPRLAPLANHGGPTRTMALFPDSPAINQIPIDAKGGCLVSNPLMGIPPITTDQRGVSRPQGGLCDIGAYEATHSVKQPPPARSGMAFPIQAPLRDRTSYNTAVLAARMKEFLRAAK